MSSASRTLSALKYDLKFQFRHGFYHVYLIITVLYILVLRFLPDGILDTATILILFTDPSVLGFFFIGGILLFERGQNIHASLFTTPVHLREYLWAKALSLALLALLSSFAIIVFTYGFNMNPLPLFFGILLSSIFFTLIGLTLAARFKSLNRYFFTSPLYIILFMLPLLELLGLARSPLFYLLPTKGSLLLIGGALAAPSPVEWLYSIAILIIWIVLAYLWAYRWFYRYVILQIGGGS
jgi:fluoroquinolone transport system permease protein